MRYTATNGETMNRYGLCCISLKLKEQGIGHQTMTFKRFNSLPREESLTILGDRILNNLITTRKTIEFCGQNNYVYRVSSDIFPLITYDEANVDLEDLPNHDEIQDEFDNIAQTIAVLMFVFLVTLASLIHYQVSPIKWWKKQSQNSTSTAVSSTESACQQTLSVQ